MGAQLVPCRWGAPCILPNAIRGAFLDQRVSAQHQIELMFGRISVTHGLVMGRGMVLSEIVSSI